MSSVLSCLRFTNTRYLPAQWIPSHTTVGMSRLLSAAAVAWSSSHVMSVTVCSNPSDQRAIGESVGCGPSGTKSGIDISAGLVPSCKRRQAKRSSRSHPTMKPSSAEVSVVVGLHGKDAANSDLGFFRKLWLTVLQRFCIRFVMVCTQSFDESGDIPNWTTSCFEAADTTDRVNTRLSECSWRAVKKATCFDAFPLRSYVSETFCRFVMHEPRS